MDEEYWDKIEGLLVALRTDAVLRTRHDEAALEEINKQLRLVKELRLDSRIIRTIDGRTE